MEISGNLSVFSLVGLFFLIFGLIVLKDFIFRWFKRRSLNMQTPEPWWEGATMASHLVPRLLRYVKGRAEIYIVEHDASALTAWSARRLRRFLRMTLENGSTVHYVLTAPHAGDEQRLARIKQDLEQGTNGRIEFCLIVANQAKDDDDKELVKSLVTFHPVLVEDGNQRLMWIEGYHPLSNETLVYAWEFVPSAEAATDSRWNKYKVAIAGLLQRYGSPQAMMSV